MLLGTVLDGPHPLAVRLVIHVGRQMPSVQEGQVVHRDHSHSLPIEVVEELRRLALAPTTHLEPEDCLLLEGIPRPTMDFQ